LVAVTVSVDEPPAVIDVGVAVIVTVAAVGPAATVTVACAVALPPAPVAVAVYVVVAVGVTAFVPPPAGKVAELPSLPVTVTCVALPAVTVRVEEVPAVTDVGLAEMLTVGGGFTTALVPSFTPQPVITTVAAKAKTENKYRPASRAVFSRVILWRSCVCGSESLC
jgi:hypothetical protein